MLPEKLTLGFDTSAAHCVAGLLLGDRVLAVRSEVMAVGQADRLVPMLEEILAEANFSWADLHAIGVGVGPGNFTGIRISVAAARGFALALEIPAIGVTVLEALAFGSSGDVLVTLDGRLGEYYGQWFHDAHPMDEARRYSLGDFWMGSMECVGFDNATIAATLGGRVGSDRTVPDPIAIARIAASRLRTKHPSPVPFYLRLPDAEPSTQPIVTITP